MSPTPHARRHAQRIFYPAMVAVLLLGSWQAAVTGFKLPESVAEGYKAHYADIDIYGTVNFNDYVGAQIGWRSLDVGYLVEDDMGSFDFRGLYFGIVARY